MPNQIMESFLHVGIIYRKSKFAMLLILLVFGLNRVSGNQSICESLALLGEIAHQTRVKFDSRLQAFNNLLLSLF